MQWCESDLESIFDDLDVGDLFGSNKEDTSQEFKDQYKEDYPDAAPVSEKAGVAGLQYFLNYLGDVEDENECAGVCTQKEIYYFSDISNGVPQKNCKEPLQKEIKKAWGNYGVGCIIIGLLLCIPFLLHIPLLFSCKDCWRDAAFFPT